MDILSHQFTFYCFSYRISTLLKTIWKIFLNNFFHKDFFWRGTEVEPRTIKITKNIFLFFVSLLNIFYLYIKHHRQVMLVARRFLTIFRHPSLSSTAPRRSATLHPCSAQSWCMNISQQWRVHEQESIKNVTFELIFISPAVPCIPCPS